MVVDNMIVEMLILSDKFRTRSNISINSLISVFSKKYPEHIVNQKMIDTNEFERECIYLCAKGERGVQFEVNGNDVIYEEGCSFYKIKDNTGNSKIIGISISKSEDDEYDSSFKNRENEKSQNEIANQEEAQRVRQEKSSENDSEMFSKGYDCGYAAGVAAKNYYEHTENASAEWKKEGKSGTVHPSFESGWNAGWYQGRK